MYDKNVNLMACIVMHAMSNITGPELSNSLTGIHTCAQKYIHTVNSLKHRKRYKNKPGSREREV